MEVLIIPGCAKRPEVRGKDWVRVLERGEHPTEMRNDIK